MTHSPRPVALYTYDLDGGGAEKYTVQLANGLIKKKCPVDLLVQTGLDKSPYLGDIHPSVRQIEINTQSPFKAVRFLYAYFKNQKPRVLFGVQQKPSLVAIVAAFFAGYRNVVPTMHIHMHSYTTVDHRLRRNVLRLLVAFFYRLVRLSVAVSTDAGAAMQDWVGRKAKIRVIPNGFDLDELRQRVAEPVDFPWLACKELPVFIGCGRLVPQKGFDVLIEAFARLRTTEPARLIILGEGELRDDLNKQVARLGIEGDVAMPGFVTNPLAWFARSDAFVLSSRTEGFGIVLVEALLSGTQIVSTDCPSGPTEILRNGAYGQLVPVDDVPAMAEAMKKVIKDKQDRTVLSSEIRSYIDEHYSLDGMVEAYLSIVEELSP